MSLEFNIENFQNINTNFADQKFVSAWAGVYTIKKYNLLQRAGKVSVIIDNLVNSVNLKHNNLISTHIHLEAMRNGLYDDLGKTVFNEVSHQTKKEYPEYAKKYKRAINETTKGMNLSKNETVIFLSKIADILNSYQEAKLENSLGNNTPDIIQAISCTDKRLEDTLLGFSNKELGLKIVSDCKNLIDQPNSSPFSKIIDINAKQTEIDRWSKRLTLNDFKLLEHSARVTALVDVYLQLFKKENNFDKDTELNIFRYAMYHDYPEVILNDMPSPVKRQFPELADAQKGIEKIIMNPLNLQNSKVAKFICKIADVFDCLYEAKKEINSGNKDYEFKKVVNEYNLTYQNQLNKFEKYIKPEIIKNIQILYLDPEIFQIEEKTISQINKFKCQFLDNINQTICDISNNKVSPKEINYLNKTIIDFTDSQLFDLKLKLQESVFNNKTTFEKLTQSGVVLDKILFINAPEVIISELNTVNKNQIDLDL